MFFTKGAAETRSQKLEEFLVFIVNSNVVKYAVVQTFLNMPATLKKEIIAVWDVLDRSVFEGWAEKIGGTYKNWRKRYVRCCVDFTLRYFEDDSLENQKGTVDLRDVVQSRQDLS